MCIYSDGLNEAENKERQQFGNERMLDLLRNTKIENARQAIELLVDRVKQYRDGAEANDDLTMMVVYIK
jgi:sigma-B regulation protein RsbU (phosphoserine phosphatase)